MLRESLSFPLLGLLCISAAASSELHRSNSMDRDYSHDQVLLLLKSDTHNWDAKDSAGDQGAHLSLISELYEMNHDYSPYSNPARIHCLCYRLEINLAENVYYTYGFNNWSSGHSNTHLLDTAIKIDLTNPSRFSVCNDCPKMANLGVNGQGGDAFHTVYDPYSSGHLGNFGNYFGAYAWEPEPIDDLGPSTDDAVKANMPNDAYYIYQEAGTTSEVYSSTKHYTYISHQFGAGDTVVFYGSIGFVPTSMPSNVNFQIMNNFMWGYYDDWNNKSFAYKNETYSFSLPTLTNPSW